MRPIRPGEHDAVAALTVAAYEEIIGEWVDDDYRAELVDVAGRARDGIVLVAVDPAVDPAVDGAVDARQRLLGSVTYLPGPGPWADFETEDEASIRMLAVSHEARRRGAGTALVQACIDLARSDGRARLSLHTTAPMTEAQRLYQRLGFRRAAERDQWVDRGTVHLWGYVLDL